MLRSGTWTGKWKMVLEILENCAGQKLRRVQKDYQCYEPYPATPPSLIGDN
jgi:hypothetical protein